MKIACVVVSYRNSTSNHNTAIRYDTQTSVVSYRNSTSNHNSGWSASLLVVVVSYRNSTSNHNTGLITGALGQVVSYRNSTSNHNIGDNGITNPLVVSYRNSTSNHNNVEFFDNTIVLYLIEILHQTTTRLLLPGLPLCCILSKFYIKPQLDYLQVWRSWCCILSKFYIKPQPWARLINFQVVVSYRNSTSNHNTRPLRLLVRRVVSYRNSTSNHNTGQNLDSSRTLYLIEILHQTTTLLPILPLLLSCILSKFYIKPQHFDAKKCINYVVSYRNSTSNHNVP